MSVQIRIPSTLRERHEVNVLSFEKGEVIVHVGVQSNDPEQVYSRQLGISLTVEDAEQIREALATAIAHAT